MSDKEINVLMKIKVDADDRSLCGEHCRQHCYRGRTYHDIIYNDDGSIKYYRYKRTDFCLEAEADLEDLIDNTRYENQ